MQRVVTETVSMNGEKNILKKSDENFKNGKFGAKTSKEYKMEIKWINVILLTYIHGAALYSCFRPVQYWSTVAIGWIYSIVTGMGTTVAAHRYFTHRSFKANKGLKFFLLMCQTMTAQEPVLHWARDHRVHHKFTDTDADPYNSRRGFFFSHIGWLMCKKHPEVIKQGKKVDMSDLENDPWLIFQKKYYIPLAFLLNFVIPVYLGLLCGESFSIVWNRNLFRYIIILNFVWCVNSVAHIWGMKPYDKNISPTDSRFVGFIALGEGWHNYHHVFPWDYKTGESPNYRYNLSSAFIDFCAWMGWATELKTVPDDIIRKRVLRTGDGSHRYSKEAAEINNNHHNNNNNNINININNNNEYEEKIRDTEHFWGFGDKEMNSEDMKYVKVL